VYTAGLNINF